MLTHYKKLYMQYVCMLNRMCKRGQCSCTMVSAVVTLADLKVMDVEIDLNEDAQKKQKMF